MAVFANVAGPDVVEGLAGCVCAVVTAEAVAGNVCMIEGRRQPRYRCMAVVTIITAGNVRLTLAQRDRIVVTGYAGTYDLRMIDAIRRRPEDVIVAVLADITGQDMVEGLAGRFRAIVTTDAIARDIGMIKIRRDPRVGGMAVVTVVAAGNVRLILA